MGATAVGSSSRRRRCGSPAGTSSSSRSRRPNTARAPRARSTRCSRTATSRGSGSTIYGRGPRRSPTTSTKRSIDEAELDDRPERRDAIERADLLAFVVGPPAVGDRHLVDAAAELRDLRGDLRLEVEAVRADADLLEHRTAEHLVARLHVGEVQVL